MKIVPRSLHKSSLQGSEDFLFPILDGALDIAVLIILMLLSPAKAYRMAKVSVSRGARVTPTGIFVLIVCALIMTYVIIGVSRCFSFTHNESSELKMWVDWWWVSVEKLFV
jgi:hypothetical protein